MPNFKLSQFGITKEEQDYLSTRLHPEVNRVFLENIAKKNNLLVDDIEAIDYKDNEIWQAEQSARRRELNAKRNVEYKGQESEFKTLAHAKMLDKKSKHILLEDDSERYGKTESKREILKAIGKDCCKDECCKIKCCENKCCEEECDDLFRISEDEDDFGDAKVISRNNSVGAEDEKKA